MSDFPSASPDKDFPAQISDNIRSNNYVPNEAKDDAMSDSYSDTDSSASLQSDLSEKSLTSNAKYLSEFIKQAKTQVDPVSLTLSVL
jgi:hypothetical protein